MFHEEVAAVDLGITARYVTEARSRMIGGNLKGLFNKVATSVHS
jgi:hypothetical protein